MTIDVHVFVHAHVVTCFPVVMVVQVPTGTTDVVIGGKVHHVNTPHNTMKEHRKMRFMAE